MERLELAAAIFRTAHLTGHFTLHSGAVSNEYFDKYRFESDPSLLRAVTDHLAPLLPATAQMLAGGSGASVNFGSTLHVGTASLEKNDLSGVDLAGGSVAHFGFGGGVGVIRDNGGHGLLLLDTSVASSSFEGGTAQIVDNAGFGVFCSGPPAVAQISNQIGTVSGNGLGDINCPISQ